MDLCEAKHKGVDQRIDAIEKRLEKLEDIYKQIHSIAVETKHIRQEVTELSSRVKDIESKSGKKYDATVQYIIFTIIGFALATIFSLIGG